MSNIELVSVREAFDAALTLLFRLLLTIISYYSYSGYCTSMAMKPRATCLEVSAQWFQGCGMDSASISHVYLMIIHHIH